ncbi:signal transduction protein [Levilactobacillus suantsaii]|uniref:Signal transduction protein n=1 Tax=Levilactobacillus suantsaii TaxID=2292255 RepID=A0A4V1LF83_9LACO|nr:signal transduction protein [Levilactobacillus suantsaii]QMU08459.1 signal transduction protein [Levilactobacillus suantsaii]RXI77567.1 signal transduction protein [Levilactobacillus suantsaii]
MITVTAPSLWLAGFVMSFWVIYFQYYWFPQLRGPRFVAVALGLAGLYATLDCWLALHLRTPVATSLPAVLLLGGECLWLGRRHNWRYLPAFMSVSILAYLLTEFIDALVTTVLIAASSLSFATTLVGTGITLAFDSGLFILLVWVIWSTQAPLENLIQSLWGRGLEFLLLGLMSALMLVFILFEYSLQALNRSASYMVMLTGISGVFILGFTLSLYILVQSHLQTERTRAQLQDQRFHDQYRAELHRQLASVRKFQHDYQNMLLGLGGYLADQDYTGFRQFYGDIRSRWTTSNAAELTMGDLINIPQMALRYEVYHQYLVARRLGVALYVRTPTPLTVTMAGLHQVTHLITQVLAQVLPAAATLIPAVVTLELLETQHAFHFRLTFPVAAGAQVVAHHRIVSAQGNLDFNRVIRQLTGERRVTLRVKLHWGQLEITFPKK